jgi:hypothetical protein
MSLNKTAPYDRLSKHSCLRTVLVHDNVKRSNYKSRKDAQKAQRLSLNLFAPLVLLCGDLPAKPVLLSLT